MITFENVTKTVFKHNQTRYILRDVSITIPTDSRIAVVGTVAADVLILAELFSGIVVPTRGRIVRQARISFPVGFLGGFDLSLSIRFNAEHVARLYNVEAAPFVQFVQAIAEIGNDFDKPLGLLSRQDQRMIAEIIAFCIPFDLYVLSRNISRKRARPNCYALFEARARECGILFPSRDFKTAPEICNAGLLLDAGQLHLFDDLRQAQQVLASL